MVTPLTILASKIFSVSEPYKGLMLLTEATILLRNNKTILTRFNLAILNHLRDFRLPSPKVGEGLGVREVLDSDKITIVTIQSLSSPHPPHRANALKFDRTDGIDPLRGSFCTTLSNSYKLVGLMGTKG
jgi:hypothetical protein